jgi:Cytidylate kinase-like family
VLDDAPSVAAVAARIVCISRTLAAGGEEVGRLVANGLGFRLLDEQIVARAARKAGLDPEQVADAERRKSFFQQLRQELGRGGGEGYAYAGVAGLVASPAMYTDESLLTGAELRALIREAIDEAAEEGETVIVAHAASIVLAGRSEVLRVLITASPEIRGRRLAATHQLEQKEARNAVEESDASRADYLKRFYGATSEALTHYDLVLST